MVLDLHKMLSCVQSSMWIKRYQLTVLECGLLFATFGLSVAIQSAATINISTD